MECKSGERNTEGLAQESEKSSPLDILRSAVGPCRGRNTHSYWWCIDEESAQPERKWRSLIARLCAKAQDPSELLEWMTKLEGFMHEWVLRKFWITSCIVILFLHYIASLWHCLYSCIRKKQKQREQKHEKGKRKWLPLVTVHINSP